jgi:hypothetical protein
MENHLGVFFTCYTEVEAVEYAINRLYDVYPEISVYLVSDGGSDFSFLQNGSRKIETRIEKDSRGVLMSLKNTPDEKQKVLESIFIFLRRINDSINFNKSKFMLIMESDVLVRGKLNIPENTVLLGSKVNPWIYKEDEINKIIVKFGGKPVHGYGCTPVIFRSEIFQEVYQILIRNQSIISELCDVTYQVAMYDVLLPVIFALKDHSEEFNPDIIECLRNPNWENTNHPVLHQFRKYYPKNNYDGIHAGENF